MAVSTLSTPQYWSGHQSHGCRYTVHSTILVRASVTWLSVHCPLHNTGQGISHMAVSTLPTSQYWSVHQSHGCQYTAHLTILVSASVTWLSVHCPLHSTGLCISHMAVSVHCPLHNTGHSIRHMAVSVHCPLHNTGHSISHMAVSVHCPLHNTGQCISATWLCGYTAHFTIHVRLKGHGCYC